MIVLGIETSCDETAASIIEASGHTGGEIFIDVLANVVHTQIEMHKQYGGVFPTVAKREHSINLIPVLKSALEQAGMLKTLEPTNSPTDSTLLEKIETDLKREPELLEQFLKFIPTIDKPKIDAIAFTKGPGLEPALWVGINFAKALGAIWNIPVIPVNHMEGHILISLLKQDEEYNAKRLTQNAADISSPLPATRFALHALRFPALALLISGGHTELVLMTDWLKYTIVGSTRDDAVGEAFDKVARILGLPYPGGPEISKLAEQFRKEEKAGTTRTIRLPRPMINSDNYDFSFAGLKTSVLYLVKKIPNLNEAIKKEIACEFEDAITETLFTKTIKAIDEYNAETLIIGGGVAANNNIRTTFEAEAQKRGSLDLKISPVNHSTDNALMIAIAGYLRFLSGPTLSETETRAEGNLKL